MRNVGRNTVGVPVSTIGRVAHTSGISFPIQVTTTTATITAGTPSLTVGSWTEMVASTTQEANGLIVRVTGVATSATDTRQLLDIGFGAAGSEVSVVSSIPTGYAVNFATAACVIFHVPIRVPLGTRISMRLQAKIASDTCAVILAVMRIPGAPTGQPRTVTLGADTVNAKGTNLPSNDTYVQITAATTERFAGLIMLPCAGTGTTYAGESSTYTLGVGSAGSEVALLTSTVTTTTGEEFWSAQLDSNAWSNHLSYYGDIPVGSRIACKQSVGRTYRDVIVLGIPYG